MWNYIQTVTITILTRYLGRLVASEIYFKHEEYKKEAENKIHDLQIRNAKLDKLNTELTDHIKQLNDEITERMSVEEKLDSISKTPKKNDWTRGSIPNPIKSEQEKFIMNSSVKEPNDSPKSSSKGASEADVSSSISSDSSSSSVSSSDGGSSGM